MEQISSNLNVVETNFTADLKDCKLNEPSHESVIPQMEGNVKNTYRNQTQKKDSILINSTPSAYQNIIKEGYLSRKTEHYHLLGSNSAPIGKTWKIYKVVLRGTKLYFFKPPQDVTELKNMFPVGKIDENDLERSSRLNNNVSIPMSYHLINSGSPVDMISLHQSKLLSSERISKKGLELVPSMFDASTRLLLFSDTVSPFLSSVGDSNTQSSNSPNSSLKQTSQVSSDPSSTKPAPSNLIAKYLYGDAFFELDIYNMRFKQQLVLLIFEDNVMVLTKKWVRITRSIEQQTGQKGEKDVSVNNSGKTMTKLTFDASYPLHSLVVVPTVTVVPEDQIAPHGLAETNLHRKEETIYCFEFILPEGKRRFFRARNSDASNNWIKEFDIARERYHLKYNIPMEPQFRPSADDPISSEDIVKMASNLPKREDGGQVLSNQRRQRKFWGVGKHPELYILSEEKDGSDSLIGGSTEGLIHEYIFHNVHGNGAEHASFYENLGRVLVATSSGPTSGKFLLDELHRIYQLVVDKAETVYTQVIERIISILKEFFYQVDPSMKVFVEELLLLISRKDFLNETIKNGIQSVLDSLKVNNFVPEAQMKLLQAKDVSEIRLDAVKQSISNQQFLKVSPTEIAKQIFAFHAETYKIVFQEGFISSLLHSWDFIEKQGDFFKQNRIFSFFLPNQVLLNGFIDKQVTSTGSFYSPLDQKSIRPMFLFNSLSQYIVKQVVSSSRSSAPAKRANLIIHWIKIGESLLADFGDIYGWACVAEALLNTSVGRLVDTWKLVDPNLIDLITSEWLPFLTGEKTMSRSDVVIPQVSTVLAQVAEKFQSDGFNGDNELLKRGYLPLERWIWATDTFYELVKKWCPENVTSRLNLISKNPVLQEWLSSIYEVENSGAKIMDLPHVSILKELYNIIERNESEVSSILFKYAQGLSVSIFQDSLISEPPRHYSMNHSCGNQSFSGSDVINIVDVAGFFTSFGPRAQRTRADSVLKKRVVIDSPLGSPSQNPKKIVGDLKKDKTNNPQNELSTLSSKLVFDNNCEFFVAVESILDNESVNFVKAGTQERLLDFLVMGNKYIDDFSLWNHDSYEDDDLFDDIFMKAYFATYRSFATPVTLLEGLKRRWVSAEKNFSVDLITLFRVKILRLVEYWINRYFVDFMDDMNAQESLFKFLISISSNNILSQTFQQSIAFLMSAVFKRIRIPLVIPSAEHSLVVNLSQKAALSESANSMTEFNLDDVSIANVTKSLGYYASLLFKNIQMVEWVQVIDLLENSSSGFAVSYHRLSKQIRPKGISNNDESAIEVSDIFTVLSLIYPPTCNLSKSLLQSQQIALSNWNQSGSNSLSTTPNFNYGTRDKNLGSINESSSQKLSPIISSPSAPLLTLLPSSVQSLYHFHQNLKNWALHQVLSASSARHRIQRIKLLLEVARQARRFYGRGNIILRAILSALVAPESRIFGKAWSTLHEMPVDGTDMKTKKADKEKFECAESYVELLELLFDEVVDVLLPQTLLKQLMNDRADVPLEILPSLEDILDFFVEIAIYSPDIYLAQKDTDGTVKLVFNQISSSSATLSNNGSSSKGISANMGLPLVNFEKRLCFYALCNKLSDITLKTVPLDPQPLIDFCFLLIPDYVAGNQQFYCNFDFASQAAIKDNEGKAAVLVSKGKLKFFTTLLEDEKDLRKNREKEWKRLEAINEKKLLNSKGTVIKSDKAIKPSTVGIGNIVQQQPSSSIQMISNILRLRSRGSLGSVNLNNSPSYRQANAITSGHNRSGSMTSSTSPSHASQKGKSNNDLSQSAPFISVPALNAQITQTGYSSPSQPSSVNASQNFASTAVLSNVSDNIGQSVPPVKIAESSSSTQTLDRDKQSYVSYSLSPITNLHVKRNSETAVSFLSMAMNDPRYSKPVKVVSLLQSRSHVATDYAKRNYVFRILTEDEQEILLQSISRDDMFDWIKKLNEASKKIEDDSRIFAEDISKKEKESLAQTSSPEQTKNSKVSTLGNNLKKKTDDSLLNTEIEKDGPKTFRVDLVQQLVKEFKTKLLLEEKKTLEHSSPFSFWRRGNNNRNIHTVMEVVKPLEEKPFIIWDEANSIPIIAEKCFHEVEERGLEEVGIYRLSGSNNMIKEVKKLFDSDPFSVDLSKKSVPDINVVTGLLKLYLRELPEPLMTFELFDDFIQASNLPDYDDRLIAIKDLIHTIPKPNYYFLKRLVEHLEKVTDFEETNNMYATNLAIVFGPTLLRPPSEKWYAERSRKLEQEISGNQGDVGSNDDARKTTTLEEDSYDEKNVASSMQFLGQCSTVVKNMILQYHWLFDVDRENATNNEQNGLVSVTKIPFQPDIQIPINSNNNLLNVNSLINSDNDLDEISTVIDDQEFIEEVLDDIPPVTRHGWDLPTSLPPGTQMTAATLVDRSSSEVNPYVTSQTNNSIEGPEPLDEHDE